MRLDDHITPHAIQTLLDHVATIAGSTIQLVDLAGHVVVSANGNQSLGGLGEPPPPVSPEGVVALTGVGAAGDPYERRPAQGRAGAEAQPTRQSGQRNGAAANRNGTYGPRNETAVTAEVVAVSVGGVHAGEVRASGGDAKAAAELAAGIVDQHLRSKHELDSLSGELLAKYEELTLLYDLGHALGAVFSTADIASIAVDHAERALGVRRAAIFMPAEAGRLQVVASDGIPLAAGLGTFPVGSQAMEERRPIFLHASDPTPEHGEDERAMFGPTLLSVPIVISGDDAEGEVYGALTVGTSDKSLFTSGDAMLAAAIASRVASSVYKSRAVESLREAERVRGEIEVASRIQQSLLPESPPDISGAEVAGLCIAADNVGGDYYDFVVDHRRRVHLLLADVSGHNVGSALMMAVARSALRSRAAAGLPPDDILTGANMALREDLERSGHFLTALVGRFDPETGRFLFSNGGNHPPLHVSAADRGVRRLEHRGMMLGVLDEADYTPRAVDLGRGDAVVLYTDGAVEARNADGRVFGEHALAQTVANLAGLPPAIMARGIYSAIQAHSGGNHSDDITLIVLKRNSGGDYP